MANSSHHLHFGRHRKKIYTQSAQKYYYLATSVANQLNFVYIYSSRMSLCRDIRHFSFTVLAIYSQQDNGISYTGFVDIKP